MQFVVCSSTASSFKHIFKLHLHRKKEYCNNFQRDFEQSEISLKKRLTNTVAHRLRIALLLFNLFIKFYFQTLDIKASDIPNKTNHTRITDFLF